MLWLYQQLTKAGKPLLKCLLRARQRRGKEDPERMGERQGIPACPRPPGPVVWLHAASVGEVQSMLVLMNTLLQQDPTLTLLITSGTTTSARLLENRLPARAIHQYIPLDHPDWVSRFLDHWHPDLVLWTESELWPNMLMQIRRRMIPAALINARLSSQSLTLWRYVRRSAATLLDAFDVILTQTSKDSDHFKELGGKHVITGDNIKYAASPLPVDHEAFAALQKAAGLRPRWVYASTHDGEEELACSVYKALQTEFQNLLTIIVPRHPERRDSILSTCLHSGLTASRRGQERALPTDKDQIYIADTIGELGLFYQLGPVSCIGRSFSHDGGGGHNPLEAALLGCAVISGPAVQNLSAIYDDMSRQQAVKIIPTAEKLSETIALILKNPAPYQEKSRLYAQQKAHVLHHVLQELEPVFLRAGLPAPKSLSSRP